MTDALAALLSSGAVPEIHTTPNSRYTDVGVATYLPRTDPGAEPIPVAFLRRRLIPRPERFALLHEVTCTQSDRRDLLAATHLGDVELWWRIADASGVTDPAEMTIPVGRRLRITLPADVPGVPGD